MNNEALYNSDPASFRVIEMLENIPDCFLSVDNNWKITYINKCFEQTYKVSRWDLTGKKIWDIFPESSGEDFTYNRHFTHCLESQEAIEFEEYSPYAKIWLYLKVYPITDGLAIYTRNITKEKELRDQVIAQARSRINQQNEQLRRIAWMQSHKMRRPVANLLGIVELMKLDFPERMTGNSLMEALYDSVVQIDEITREIVLATKDLEL